MYKLEAKLQSHENLSSLTCYDEEEATTCFCTLEGPFHLPNRSEDYDSLVVDVKWRGQDPKETKYYSHLLRSILEHFLLLELDSSKGICLSLYITGSQKYSLLTSLNSALLALIKEEIPLKSLFYGVQVNQKLFVFNDQDIVFTHFLSSDPERESQEKDLGLEKDLTSGSDLFDYTKEILRFSIRDQHTI